MKYFVIFVLLVLISFSVYFSGNSAYGLSCDRDTISEYFENNDVVFLGNALSKDYQPSPSYAERFDAITLFSVIEPYKGIPQKMINVTSSEWFWGANFTEGLGYVVFANYNYDYGMLEHALCTPHLTSEFDLEELRQVSQNYVLPPLFQLEFGVNPHEIQCKENLILIQKYDGSPACVKPETVSKLVAREWGISDNWIKISNVNKAINYQIDNAKITSIQAFSEHKNPSLQEEIKQTWLKINLESKQEGSLKITLPRNLIDSKIGHADDGFFVLLDGTETEYQETGTESERILNFSIPAKTDIIEIIGYDYYNPELNQFEIIKKNIDQIGYEICDIRLENDKIIIDLHKFFEDSEPEKKIISKIPPYVEYEIIYHEGYSDYFISTTTSHNCE